MFVKPFGGWTSEHESAELTPSDAQYHESFGTSVALSNDGGTLAVGNPSDGFPGGVYVFVRNSFFGWFDTTQTAKLTDTFGNSHDQLGQSVGISSDGSIIAAGAAGAAYIFVERPSGWINATETAKLPIPPGQTSNTFIEYQIGICGDGG